jgi:hypothetical protein
MENGAVVGLNSDPLQEFRLHGPPGFSSFIVLLILLYGMLPAQWVCMV